MSTAKCNTPLPFYKSNVSVNKEFSERASHCDNNYVAKKLIVQDLRITI